VDLTSHIADDPDAQLTLIDRSPPPRSAPLEDAIAQVEGRLKLNAAENERGFRAPWRT
jgi:hypothetical protein